MKLCAAFFFVLNLFFPASGRQQPRTADLVVINADVRTMDERRPRAEALAVIENKIVFAGKTSDAKKFIGAKTNVIDAGGRLLLPGFNDAHVHVRGMGNLFSAIDLRLVSSLEKMAEAIAYQTRFLPKGRWILGGQWNEENWASRELPDRKLIDAATADNPVFLYNKDPKVAFANTLALKLAGIDEAARDPAGGEFVRDENGRLTGVLKGSAVGIVRRAAPVSPTKDLPAVIETASNYAAAYGVTSLQDMSADDNYEVLRGLEQNGKLKTRVYDCTGLSEWLKAGSPKFTATDAGGLVRRGCLKYFAESDPGSVSELSGQIAAADRAGWQVMIHAIGSRPNKVILSVFENVIKTNGARDRRLRVEHAHNIRPEDFKRFSASKVIASMQPALFFGGVLEGSEPYRSLLDAGVKIAFGSDSSMIPVNPFDGIYAAAMAFDKANGGAEKTQSLSVEEAVRLYTAGAAYAEFQEHVKGSIEAGKYADFIILSQNIFSVPVEKIPETEVLMTVVDGRIVYEKK
jgi:predicted amidohydrolase YtcJ